MSRRKAERVRVVQKYLILVEGFFRPWIPASKLFGCYVVETNRSGPTKWPTKCEEKEDVSGGSRANQPSISPGRLREELSNKDRFCAPLPSPFALARGQAQGIGRATRRRDGIL